MAVSSSTENILPMGLWGVLITIIFVREEMAASSLGIESVHSEELADFVAPFTGGNKGT